MKGAYLGSFNLKSNINSSFRFGLKFKTYISLLIILLLTHPLFIIPMNRLQKSLNRVSPISDEYYFERIFFAQKSNWNVYRPVHFVNSSTVAITETISIGESFQRLMYFCFNFNIILTYFVFSLLCLFLIFIFLVKFLNLESQNLKLALYLMIVFSFLE